MANSLDDEDTNTEKIPMTEENGERPHSPSDVDDMIPHKVQPSIFEILFEFTQRTTFHGVRIILRDHVGIVRRIVWFVLFLTCTVLMMVQISDRVIHYYSYPVTVNFDVNFDKIMAFPTLTICNQNTFRATAVSQRSWYRLIGEVYSSNVNVDAETLESFNATVLTLHDVYQGTAHKKEDFIVSCEWQNEICGPENFTEVLTDQGVCYSFNDNRAAPLFASYAGTGNGLKLTLNVEQYDYLPRPHNAAGIKFLLHDRNEYPRVAEQGLAAPTGMQTFVGIGLLKIKNLDEPRSKCRSGESIYYKEYSPDACQLACMTEYLAAVCDCRHVYMPQNADGTSVCTVAKYLVCLKGAMVSAMEHVKEKCDCPAPCDYLIYEPHISYASTSMFSTNRLLATTSSVSLRNRFLQARETTSRLDRTKFQIFSQLTNEVKTSFRDLQSALTKGLQTKLQTQKTHLSSIYDTMKIDWSKKKHLLEWQRYHIEKNFVFAKEQMEDRSMFYLTFGYEDFRYKVESKIKQIAGISLEVPISEEVKTALYVEVLNMLNSRIHLAETAYESFTKLHDAYKSGEPIFAFQFQEEPVENNVYITPKPLLKYSLTLRDKVVVSLEDKGVSPTIQSNDSLAFIDNLANNNTILEHWNNDRANNTFTLDYEGITPVHPMNHSHYHVGNKTNNTTTLDDEGTTTFPLITHSPYHIGNKTNNVTTFDDESTTPAPPKNHSQPHVDNAADILEKELIYLRNALHTYASLAKRSFTGNITSPEEIDTHGSQFSKLGPKFDQSKNAFYSEIVDYPLKTMQQKVADFDKKWKEFEQGIHFMANKMEFLLVNLSKFQKSILSTLDQNIAKAQNHISYNNVTKLQVAEDFTSNDIQKGISDLRTFFTEIRARGLEIFDGWTALNKSSNDIWATILDDENMVEYYRHNNQTEFLRSFSYMSLLVGKNIGWLRDYNNIQAILGQHDSVFLKILEKMITEMKDFIRGSALDTEFLKNNFLGLDVSYSQKGYRQLTQQATYDIFALFCDIGGTMALFLGASVLTLCELLDLGLHHAIYRLTHNEKIH